MSDPVEFLKLASAVLFFILGWRIGNALLRPIIQDAVRRRLDARADGERERTDWMYEGEDWWR